MTRETYWNCRFSRRGGPIADGHWKELPHHFFNRQSAISPPRRDNENLVFELRLCRAVRLWTSYRLRIFCMAS
jgi:hypothetical protein